MSKTFMNWSSGKDSAMALHKMIESGQKPELLITTINQETQRIGMHGLRRELLERQAAAIGIPLKIIELSSSLDHEAYNQLMTESCLGLKEEGFSRAVFGDIFLEDLRNYREEQLRSVGLEAIFPLWKEDTSQLIHYFIEKGFKSCIVAAHADHFTEEFVGSEIEDTFLSRIPDAVDPCGENGEFHSFCYDGPIFAHEVEFERAEKVIKTYPNPSGEEAKKEIGFHFIELI